MFKISVPIPLKEHLMKRLSLTLLTCLATGLLGCSKTPTPSPTKEPSIKEKLIVRGKGTETSTDPKKGEPASRRVLEFHEDGKFQVTTDGHKQEPMSYDADSNKLTLTQTGPGGAKRSVVFSIETLTDTEFVYKTPFDRAGKLTKDTTPPPPPLAKKADKDFIDSFPPKVVYATPQEVFDAAYEAQSKGNHETFVRCLSPRLQYDMAAEMATKGLDISMGQARRKGKEAELK